MSRKKSSKMDIKDAVVKRFTDLCRDRGITTYELAKISDVPVSTAYTMFEAYRRNISIVTIKRLCDGLGITLKDFFDSEEFKD